MILFSIVVSVFIVWNIIWYLLISHTYNPLVKEMPKDNFGEYYIENDGYSYYATKPDYLSSTGNLVVTRLETDNCIIIWPSIYGNKVEYGAMIKVGNTGIGITIDENLNPINDSEEDSKVIDDNKKELEELMAKAKVMWDLQ